MALLRRLACVVALLRASAASSLGPEEKFCDGLWTPQEVKGQVVFRIDSGIVHWTDSLTSRLLAVSSRGITLDLQGADKGLHQEAELVEDKLLWNNGDIWVKIESNLNLLSQLDGHRWTQAKAPGKNIYAAHAGFVSGGDIEAPTKVSMFPDGRLSAVLRGRHAVGTIKKNFDIQWDGDEGLWLALMSPTETASKLDGIMWTEEEHPWIHTYSVVGTSLLGGETVDPFIMLVDGKIFTGLGDKMMTGMMLDNGEIHWENGDGIWVTTQAVEEMTYQTTGKRWTDNTHPGKHIYEVDVDSVTGGRSPGLFQLMPDSTVWSSLPEKSPGRMMTNGDIHWKDGNVWVPLASREELESKIESHRWTSQSAPGEVVYLVSGDEVVEEGEKESGKPPWFILLGDGRIYTDMKGMEKGRMLENGEIKWDSGSMWVTMEDVAQMALTLEGKSWTDMSAPGRHIYSMFEGTLLGAGAPAKLELLPNGGVFSNIQGKKSGTMMDNGEIKWDGDGGLWAPIAPPASMAKHFANKAWTEASHPGAHVYTIVDGSLLRDSVDFASVVLHDDHSHIYATREGEVTSGVWLGDGRIDWEGPWGLWEPVEPEEAEPAVPSAQAEPVVPSEPVVPAMTGQTAEAAVPGQTAETDVGDQVQDMQFKYEQRGALQIAAGFKGNLLLGASAVVVLGVVVAVSLGKKLSAYRHRHSDVLDRDPLVSVDASVRDLSTHQFEPDFEDLVVADLRGEPV